VRAQPTLRAVLLAAAVSLVVAPTKPRPALLLISIDGLRPDYILDSARYDLRVPNLRALTRSGSYATGVTGVLPTVTYPSHTTLVTGASPARHGILANTTFDPLGKNDGGWYWYASDIRVPTLWDVAANAGLSTANVNWPATVGAKITWSLPQFWRSGTADDRKLQRVLSTPGLLAELETTLGPYPDGEDESVEGDEGRARFAEKLLEWRRPRVTLVYFAGLDHDQHTYGPGTPPVLASLERLDSLVGRLEAAAEKAYGKRVVVAIVSDHGFATVSRGVNLTSAFRSARLLTYASDTSTKPNSWDAAPWAAGGTAAIVLRSPDDTLVRLAVRHLLDSLAADTANGIAAVLDSAEFSKREGFPTAQFLVQLAPGFVVGSATSGPLVTPSATKGHHGFPPDSPDMRSSFIVSGEGIPSGRSLGLIDMRDIAPTLAARLGLRIPEAEGHNLLAP
jgi:predicted AlkP superfamily pyrophosphatase or phosphodiesterase